MKDKIDILIIHLNGEEVIKNCLSSIYKNTKNFKVKILLNNTTDNSKKIILKKFPNVKLYESKETWGFAKAANFLVGKSNSEHIVLINNDIIVEKNWLKELSSVMKKHKDCVICQPKVKDYYKKDFFQYSGAAGGFIDKYGYPFCRGRIFNTIEKDEGQYDDEIRIFWGDGVCLLIDREFFNKTGGFDEDFFMYAEETDFCWRTNLYGKEIWYSPKSVIYHMGSYSIKKNKLNNKKEYLKSRNHLLMFFKNYSIYSLIRIMPMRIFLEFISMFYSFPYRIFPVILSMFSIPFVFIFKTKKKRKKILKERIISDKEVNRLIYQKSIVLEYFVNKHKYYSSLKN